MPSNKDLKEQILKLAGIIQNNIGRAYLADYVDINDRVTGKFLGDINLLNQLYGAFIGQAKARHLDLDDLVSMDEDIATCFVKLLDSNDGRFSFKLVNLAIGKIFEVIAYVETMETTPEEKVPKASYDRLLREKEEAEKTAKFLVQYKGLPELHILIEKAKNIGIPIDENWVLALCSSNLIEAVVNRKLEKLGKKAEGSFKARYQKLCRIVKEKEDRDIQQLLPIALYEGIRNKLDHASDSNRVTPKEAKDISKMVIEFMNEIFQ